MNRSEIAQDLLDGCPAEELSDHEAIAAAIMDGEPMDRILEMAEVDRWPETYVYLKSVAQEPMSTDLR